MGNLLSVDDKKAFLASPTKGLLRRAALVTFAGRLADLVVHDELHQLQPGLTHQVADAFLQWRRLP